MKRLFWLFIIVIICLSFTNQSIAVYPTTTEHHKLYPYTSIMASPYSGDPTGVVDCAAAIESIKADQSNIGAIYIPKGTFRIGTNLSIPVGMTLEFAAAAYFTIDAGVTLTLPGPVVAPDGQNCFIGSGVISLGTTFPVTNTTKILQPGTWTVTTNTIIPSNIEIRPRKGAVLAVATGVTLTINGNLDAGLYQIFSCTGTGKVVYTGVKYPEWWGAVGDGVTNDAVALQAAFTAGGRIVLSGPKTYLTNSNLTFPNGCQIIGENLPIIKNGATSGNILAPAAATGYSNNVISDVTINMDSKGDCGLMWEAIWRGIVKNIKIINIPLAGTFTYDSLTIQKAGIVLKGKAGVTGCYYNLINNSFCTAGNGETALDPANFGGAGIVITNGATSKPNDNRIVQPRALNLVYGIKIDVGNDNKVIQPEVSGCTYGVYDNGTRSVVEHIYAEGCRYPVYADTLSASSQYGPFASTTATYSREYFIVLRSGTYTNGETINFTSGGTGTLIKLATFGTIELLQIHTQSGTIAVNDIATGASSGATATVKSWQNLLVANFGTANHIWDSTLASNPRFNNLLLENIYGIVFPNLGYGDQPFFIDNNSNAGYTGNYIGFRSKDASNILRERFRYGCSTDVPSFDVSGGFNAQWTRITSNTTLITSLSAGATHTWTSGIPAGSMVIGVTARVTEAIAGPTSFTIGDGTTANRFGALVGVTINSTCTLTRALAASSPMIYPSNTNVVLTATGGNFTGGAGNGKVRLTVHYITLIAPTS